MRALLALVATVSVCACQTAKEGDGAPSNEAAPPRLRGLEAPLHPLAHSAVRGSARFTRRGNGVTMLVALNGTPGTQYRVVVHANGNCTSPNGFSAGPPWSPPGAGRPLPDRLPPLTANSEGTASITIRLADVPIEAPNGLEGRSVVVHQGARPSLEAKPDVPNDRVACGVIGPLQSVF